MALDDDVLEAICSIADRFYGWTRPSSGKSVLQLARESRYEQHRNEIDRGSLTTYLEARPGVVDQWLLYSQNKRTSEGWYVEDGPRLTEVGYVGQVRENEKYTSRSEAVAAFILAELDEVLRL